MESGKTKFLKAGKLKLDSITHFSEVPKGTQGTIVILLTVVTIVTDITKVTVITEVNIASILTDV